MFSKTQKKVTLKQAFIGGPWKDSPPNSTDQPSHYGGPWLTCGGPW